MVSESIKLAFKYLSPVKSGQELETNIYWLIAYKKALSNSYNKQPLINWSQLKLRDLAATGNSLLSIAVNANGNITESLSPPHEQRIWVPPRIFSRNPPLRTFLNRLKKNSLLITIEPIATVITRSVNFCWKFDAQSAHSFCYFMSVAKIFLLFCGDSWSRSRVLCKSDSSI